MNVLVIRAFKKILNFKKISILRGRKNFSLFIDFRDINFACNIFKWNLKKKFLILFYHYFVY
jgi:hypothetical protein